MGQEWDNEARDLDWLADAVPLRDTLGQIAQLRREHAAEIAPLEATYRQARETQSTAKSLADYSERVIAVETEQNRDALLADWHAQRPAAHANARTVLDGLGRLGLKLPAVNRANEALARWSVSWQPIIPTIPTGHAEIARFADRADDTPRIYAAVDHHARRRAEARHPEHPHQVAEAAAADRGVAQAWLELRDTQSRHQRKLADYGNLAHTGSPDERLAQIEQQIATTQHRLAETRERISHLERELATPQRDAVSGHRWRPDNSPARPGQPADAVHAARTNWSAELAAKQQAAQREIAHRIAVALAAREQQQRSETWRQHEPAPIPVMPDHGIGR